MKRSLVSGVALSNTTRSVASVMRAVTVAGVTVALRIQLSSEPDQVERQREAVEMVAVSDSAIQRSRSLVHSRSTPICLASVSGTGC